MTSASEDIMKSEIEARLCEQSVQIANLRAALDVQFTRIAQMQAELDGLPQARRRRQSLRALLTQQLSHNGNERHDR
jgi:hypothetical protein